MAVKKPATKAPLKKPAPSKAVAVVQRKSTAVSDGSEFGDMPSAGLENVTQRDVIIPRLTILQALSPQVQKRDPEYIAGAQIGQFCDVATGDLFEEMEVVPCFYARVYLEWAPRASGKGLVHHHGTDSSILEKCTQDDKKRNVLPNGNYIAETATFYVVNLNTGRRSFIPLSSTQLKNARKWMTQILAEKLTRPDGSTFTPAIFFRSWKVTTREESNSEGNWVGWHFEAGDPILEIDPSRELFNECKQFFEQARDGLVTGDVSASPEDMVERSGAM